MSAAQHWYDFNPDTESVQECRDRRLLQMPILSPAEEEVLSQLRTATWDGNVASKTARDTLNSRGLIVRFNGWQIVSKEGLAVLETLGKLRA